MDTSADTQKCPSCGADIPVNALLCPKCGRANVSTAFASPSSGANSSAEGSSASFLYSTTESPVAPAQTVENTTLQVKSTEIPKTVLPWETAYTPLDTSQAPAPGNQPVTGPSEQAQAVPPAGSAGDKQADLEEIARLRKAQMQMPGDSTEEVRQIQRLRGQPSRYGTVLPTEQAHPPQGWNVDYQPGYGQGQPNWQPSNPYQNSPYQYTGGPLDSQHRQGGARAAPNVSSTVAFMLELLGYVGFLGVGHIFAGRYRRGFVIMLAWWVVMASVCRLLFEVSTQPENFIFLIALFLPVLSGFWIKYDVDRNGPRPSSQVRRN